MAYGGPWSHDPNAGAAGEEDPDVQSDEPSVQSGEPLPNAPKTARVKSQENVQQQQGMRTATESEQASLSSFDRFLMSAKMKTKQGSIKDAIADFENGLKRRIDAGKEDSDDVAKTRKLLGKNYNLVGRYREACNVLLKALNFYEKREYDAKHIWECHNFIAQSYNGLYNKDKEIEHYEEAIRVLSQSPAARKPPETLAHMHNNVANAYKKRDDQNGTDKHLRLVKEHLEKAKQVMQCLKRGNSKNMIKIHLSLGNVYRSMNLTRQAIEEIELSISVCNKSYPGEKEEGRRKNARQTLISLYKMTKNKEKIAEHETILKALLDQSPAAAKKQTKPDGPKQKITKTKAQDTANVKDESVRTLRPIEETYPNHMKPGMMTMTETNASTTLQPSSSSTSTSSNDVSSETGNAAAAGTGPFREGERRSVTGQQNPRRDDATVRQTRAQISQPASSQTRGEAQTQPTTSEVNQQRVEGHRDRSTVQDHIATNIAPLTITNPSSGPPSASSLGTGSSLTQVDSANPNPTMEEPIHVDDWSTVPSTQPTTGDNQPPAPPTPPAPPSPTAPPALANPLPPPAPPAVADPPVLADSPALADSPVLADPPASTGPDWVEVATQSDVHPSERNPAEANRVSQVNAYTPTDDREVQRNVHVDHTTAEQGSTGSALQAPDGSVDLLSGEGRQAYEWSMPEDRPSIGEGQTPDSLGQEPIEIQTSQNADALTVGQENVDILSPDGQEEARERHTTAEQGARDPALQVPDGSVDPLESQGVDQVNEWSIPPGQSSAGGSRNGQPRATGGQGAAATVEDINLAVAQGGEPTLSLLSLIQSFPTVHKVEEVPEILEYLADKHENIANILTNAARRVTETLHSDS